MRNVALPIVNDNNPERTVGSVKKTKKKQASLSGNTLQYYFIC